MKISIKKYITVVLIFFTLLPFISLRIIAYPRIQSDLKTVIMDNLEIVGEKQAVLVSTWMRERMTDVLVLAKNPYMANSLNLTKKDKEYAETLRYLEMIVVEYGYMSAFICNEKGLVTIATIEENIGRDLSKKDYFMHALQGSTFVTSIIPSDIPLVNEFDEKEIGFPTLLVSTPLKNKESEITGVVALRVHVGTLSNLMHSQKFGNTGETYLVNKEGYMLSESRFTNFLTKRGVVNKRSTLELKLVDLDTGKLTYGVAQCVAGKNGSDSIGYNDYGGIPVLGVWRWLPEFNWGVVTEIDRAEVYGVAYNLNTLGVVLLLGIAFPIVFFAYIVGTRLSNPIVELTEATEKMAAGDLTQRVNIKREDELGVLAESFNTMAKTLDKKTKEIEKSERNYRELFDSLRAGIYQCTPGVDGRFTWVNKVFAEMFGYESPEEVIGTKVSEIYVDQAERKMLVERLEKEGVWKDFTSYCKKKNGEKFYTERTSNMVKDDDGVPVRIEGVIRDTTERKRLDDELRESEEHKRQLLNSLKEGIYQCETGVEGTFMWVNQACAEMFGYESPEEMVGTKVSDIYVNPDDRRMLIEKLEKDEICRHFESLCKKKNGVHFTMERTSQMIRDEEGQPLRIEGILRDTTERKRLDDELRESEEHKRQLLNSLKEGIYQCEPGVEGTFTWVNQACVEMFGYESAENMIGTKVSNIYVDPDNRRKLVEKLEKDGISRHFESLCKKKNGAHFTMECTSHMIRDEEGKPVRVEGILRDTTEQKRL
ncbi:MAG: PAS domain S-box protein [Candidatus Scalindua sp.]|nr:PAS domain S-box protein [Candidatus Scalindua sp.]